MSEENTNNIWLLPKFYFRVKLGNSQTVSFQEVSGLDTETQEIEYRQGNSKVFSTSQMPGIAKTGNITLKKGVFTKDNTFWDWYAAIKMNTIKRETVTIQLLDEGGVPTMTWTLANAFPVKITGTGLESDGDEVAVETLELVHEGLTIENGG